VKGTTDNAGCRRYVGQPYNSANCIGGFPLPDGYTYSEALALCKEAGESQQEEYELCDRSCSLMGCNYNNAPVFSKNPCSSPAPPAPPSSPPFFPIPNTGVQIVSGDGTSLTLRYCAKPGVDDDMTTFNGKTIAGQCCLGNPPTQQCRRTLDPPNMGDNCVSGQASQSEEPPIGYTFSELTLKCQNNGLTLCDQTCSGQGCQYNYWDVWTKVPCESDIPSTGVQVVKGDTPNSEAPEFTKCIVDGDTDMKTTAGAPVAVQCCVVGTTGVEGCRRRIDITAADSDENCAGGKPPKLFTYKEAVAKCVAAGQGLSPPENLGLCNRQCAFTGCEYNSQEVLTNLPCDL